MRLEFRFSGGDRYSHIPMNLNEELRASLYVATPLGFEPRITPPKGAVLPLHHGVSQGDFRLTILDQTAIGKMQHKRVFGPRNPKAFGLHSHYTTGIRIHDFRFKLDCSAG